jgi:arsenite methyltransferase
LNRSSSSFYHSISYFYDKTYEKRQKMSMTQASSEYFQQVAGSWDSLRAGYFGEAVRQAALDKAYLRPEMVVADVGSGTGFIAAGLAPLVRRVYVVDGSAAMLDVARKNLSAFQNIEYHEADGASLPFPEESLDAVFANMYLHHCPDAPGAIREMVRVLRPGGRLVITDMDAHEYAWLKEEMADAWQGFERDQIRTWFREAGLVNVIVDCTGETCCATSAGAEAAGAEAAGADAAMAEEAASSCSCASGLKDPQGREAKISVFVATGTRRMAMREAVEQTYSAYARGGSCGCSNAAESADGACCAAAPAASSCCGSEAAESIDLRPGYSNADLASVPQEAAEIPLGCGNPVAIANLRAGEVVLDIGSGGGLDSFLSAGRVGPQGRVIGVDMTPAMLERAQAAAARAGIGNVEFRQGLAEALPVEDGLVDVILSNCVINLTEDKGQVFREAFRALKPGGRLEISDVVAGGALPIDLRENTADWSECITGALPEKEYLDLISQAGFRSISVRRSPASGAIAGVPVYSAIVSAYKEGGDVKPREEKASSSGCGCC